MADDRLFRAGIRAVVCLMASVGLSMLGAGTAQACTCDQISPAQGFERAQYVFEGKVVETIQHTWTVDVDRVWKGSERLAGRVRLLDVYAGIDCEFYFEPGRSYLFFAIIAKSSRYLYYQPQACNWTSALRSKRVPGSDGSLWLEDFIEGATALASRQEATIRGVAKGSASKRPSNRTANPRSGARSDGAVSEGLEFVVHAVLIGIGASLVLDLWTVFLKHCFGIEGLAACRT